MEITAHIAHQHGYLLFLCVHGLQDIQGQFSFSSRYLPCCRPSPAGRCVNNSSGGISRVISAFQWYIRLWTWCAHPARAPAVVFHMELCVQPASPFFIFSRVPLRHPDSPASFRAAIICGFFRCPEEFALSAATSRACENRWRSPACPAGCVTCDHTRGSERRGCCTRCRNEQG